MLLQSRCAFSALILCLLTACLHPARAQEEETPREPEVQLPEIANEPRFIDAATILPEVLAKKVTVDLSESSIAELVTWLEEEQGLSVLVDETSLKEEDILLGDRFDDRLEDDSLYLLLNRLSFRGIGWYYEGGILYLTSPIEALQKLRTVPYNIGSLRDQGISIDEIEDTVTSTIDPFNWENVGGIGALSFLGDVMFVRHIDPVHFRINGLLEAMKQPARQTFTFSSPLDDELRQKLTQPVSIRFENTPLEEVIASLAEQCGADIRLDAPELRDLRIREREPISIELSEQPLRTVLESLVLGTQLTWILEDGVIWMTSLERASKSLRTAIYDVRDLARDESESAALVDAIQSQTYVDEWDEVGGEGAIEFPQPGIMVVLQVEPAHTELLQLLEAYRFALRQSKRRQVEDENNPEEVITVYYRMPTVVAEDLIALIPTVAAEGTWKNSNNQEAIGSIMQVASEPEIIDLHAENGIATSEERLAPGVIIEQSVLIINQKRKVHDEISEIIDRVRRGDAQNLSGKGGFGGGGFGGGGGGAGGMGGFGGGYFRIEQTQRH